MLTAKDYDPNGSGPNVLTPKAISNTNIERRRADMSRAILEARQAKKPQGLPALFSHIVKILL